MLARVSGIDVTHFQGTINWSNVRAAGYEFAYEKATEAVGVLDSALATNMSGGAAAGLLMGAFHYAKPDTSANDAVNEANYFVAQAGNYMKGGWLRPAVQIDTGSALGKAALSTWVNTFVSTVQSATGVAPLVYANTDYATNYLNTSVADKSLWIANYNYSSSQAQGSSSPPTGSWGSSSSSWNVWRYSATGTVAGVTGSATNVDVFNGDRTALQSLVIAPPSNPFQLNLDFGPPTGSVVPSGYVSVASQLYGSLGGYTMGWSSSGVTTAVRSGGSAPDDRYRSYAMPALGGASRSFEVAVPNGSYTVRVVAGSPDQYPNAQKVIVEGTTAVNVAATSASAPFAIGTATVTVTDGKLTLTSDFNGAANTRIDFVDIVAAGRTSTPPAAPSAVTVSRPTGTSAAIAWQDNADNEGSYPASFNSSTWGAVSRGFEIKRRASANGTWGGWSTIGYALSNATSYTDTTADAGTTYQYRVAAVNSTGKSSEVESNGVPPRVVPSISGPTSVNEGSAYSLSLGTAGGSAAISSWSINWGDGSAPQTVVGNATTATHVFPRGPLAYTISAAASDGTASYPATSSVSVQVADVAPTLSAFPEVPFIAAGGTMIVPLGSFRDPGFGSGQAFTASVDWGDGTTIAPITPAVTLGQAGVATSGTLSGTHTFAQAGTYNVTITVSDVGGQSATLHSWLSVQPAPAPFLVPGEPGSTTLVSFTVTSEPHSSGQKNELGLFFVDDANGTIGSLAPGGTTNAQYVNYAMAALTDASRRVAVSRSAPTGTTHSYLLPAGKYVAFYMVQDATTADFVNGTFPSDYSNYNHSLIDPSRPNVFFMNPVANFDHFQHVRPSTDASDAEHYGWEDLVGGGDQDFNDIVFTLSASGAPDLTATADDAARVINLSWTATTGEHGYRIFRGTSAGSLSPFVDVASDTTHFSDASVTVGTTYFYSVAPLATNGQPAARSAIKSASLDAPVSSPGSVAGSVWNDANGDSDRGVNEAGLAGIRVYVDDNDNGSHDSTEVSTVTGASGQYQLTNVSAGTHHVRAVSPVGWAESFPANGVYSVVFSGGEAYAGKDFAFKQLNENAGPPELSAHADASTGTIGLNWTELYSDDDGFVVERSTDGLSFSQIADLAGKNQSSYADADVQISTPYYYRVRGYNHGPDGHREYYDYSNISTAMLDVPSGQSAPILTARGTIEGVNLNWTDNATDESAWVVERRTVGGSYAQVTQLDGNTFYWTDHDVTPGTRYFYRVRARVGSAFQLWSNEASALPLTGGGTWYYNNFEYNPKDWEEWSTRSQVTTPITKRRVLGAFRNHDQTTLAWTLPKHDGVTLDFDFYASGTWDGDNMNGGERWIIDVDGQKLFASGIMVSGDTRGAIGPGQLVEYARDGSHWNMYHVTLSFDHVDPKIAITFRLNQNYGDDWGTDDEEWYLDNVRLSEGTGAGQANLPDAPTNVQVGQAEQGIVRVAWTPSISPNVVRYDVYRSSFPDFPADPNNNEFFATSAGADHSACDVPLVSGSQTYYFKVVAVTRQEGRSLPSAEVTFTLPATFVIPSTPTNLRLAGGGATATVVPLAWDDQSDNEKGFTIERSADGVVWGNDDFYSSVIGSSDTNVPSFADKIFGGTTDTLFFRVAAWNGVGASAYSNVLEVHVPPPEPGVLRVSPSGQTGLGLAWAWSGYPATSFTIERSTLPTFPSPDLIATVAATSGVTSFGYTDEGLDENVKYYYRVTANGRYSDAGASLPAYGTGIITGDLSAPPAPTGLSFRQEPEGVTLTWDPADVADGVIGYRVYRVQNGSWRAMQGLEQPVDPNTPWWSDLDDAIPKYTRYGVSAVDAGLNESEMAQVVIGEIGDGAPANPTGLDAKSYPQAIQLTWEQGPESDLAGWNVYRQVEHYDGGRGPAWLKLNGELVTDDLGYNDYEVSPGDTRVYRVTAVDIQGHESSGTTITQYRSFGAEPPAPTHVRAVAAPSGQVRVGWDSVTPVLNAGDAGDALSGYKVFVEQYDYYSNQNYWLEVATAGPTATNQLVASGSYGNFDSTTNPGGQFRFGVATLTADGDVSDIIPVSYRVVRGQAPATPILADGSVSKTTGEIDFAWAAGSGGQDVYHWQVFRADGGGEYEFVKELVVSESTFKDVNLSPSKQYSYRVYAVDTDGDLSEPLELSVATDGVPQEAPRVRIVAPALSSGGTYPVVSSDSTVTGYVDDLNGDAVTWSLRLKTVGAPDALDFLLSTGTSEAGEFRNGQGDVLANLGTVLAGQLPNGLYNLILTASDGQGGNSPASSTVRIQLKTDFKLGSFHLPITDLSVDVPNGEPMQIVRSYDSDTAGTSGDFGYGWKLDLSNTNIRTSTQDKPGTSNHTQSGVAAYTASSKDSTLFYVTMPGGQEHVFKFTPYPLNYNPVISVDPYSIGYTGSTYVSRFVAVDGSSATLTDPNAADTYLRRDPETGEIFEYETYRPYNPARTNAATFSLHEVDGTVYEVYAKSGQIKTKTDLAGNVMSFTNGGVASSDRSLYVHRSGSANLIDWVAIQTGSATPTAADAVLVYSYNAAGELTGVLDTRTNIRTYYEYGTVGGRDHYLKVVRNPQGTPVVNVDYDAATGRLNKVLDAKGNITSVGQSSVTSSGTSQRINAPGTNGDKVERFYDSAGNVTREIRGIRAANGDIAKYIVTVHSYAYATAFDVQDAMDSGVSLVNALYGQSDYAPHEITGPDTEGARYSWQPTSDDLQSGQTFYIGDVNSPDFKQLATVTSRLANGRLQNTSFFNYKDGRPQKFVTGDGRKNTTSWNIYDDHGNVVFSIDQEGFGSHNFYDYSGIYGTRGLLLGSDHVHVPIANVNGYDPMAEYAASLSTATNEGDATIANVEVLYRQVLNTYFTGSETGAAGIGKYRGRLKSTTDVSGTTTYFHYDADGNTISTYSRWQGSGGQDKWVVGYSDFDAAGRVKKSGTRVYLNDGSDGTATFDPASDTLASDVVGQQTFFDANGRVDYTLDTYGERAQNYYDESGNLTRVLYADGTETRTVFDDRGRAIWTTDRFYTGLTYDQTSTTLLNASTFKTVATKTIYDSAGRAIGTERYRDVTINFGVTPRTWDGNTFAFFEASAPTVTTAQEIATTSTTLDANGRVSAQSSTDIATGLTTTQQTEYYIDGRVRRSRTVGSDGTATGWTSYAYGEIDKNDRRYDSVTDGLNTTTTTYTDEMGRAVQIADANGHSKNTIYWERQSTTPIDAQYAPPARIANDTTWTRQEVQIDERGAPTSRFYDAAGRLRFVLLPDPDGTAGSLTAGVWEYMYDAYGNQTSQIDPNSHTTSFAYDEQGRRISRTLPADADPSDDTEYWTYDVYGRTKTHVDFKRQVTSYVYDDDSLLALTGGDPRLAIAANRPVLGRLIEERRYVSVASYDNGAGTPAETTRYGYDALGRQSAIAEYAGATSNTYQRLATTDYDSVTGNVSTASSPEGTIHYEYDAATGQLMRTWTASNDTTDVYDAVGRLESVKTNVLNGVTHATPIVTTYGYTPTGNLDWMLDDNGTATTADDVFTDYGYDRVGRLTSETVTRGGTVSQAAGTVSGGTSVFSQAFVLDDAGNRRHVDERRDGAAWSTTDWAYDFQGRLTDEVYDRAVDNTKDYAAHFAFDAAGNRTGKTQTGYEAGTWAYTYYDRDELHTDTETGTTPHAYVYAYDANGSQKLKTGDGPDQTYAWDLRNRMSSATVAGVTTTYGYDSMGQRVSEKVGSGNTRTLLQDKNNATGYPQTLEERLGTTLDRSYRIGLSVLGQADATGTFEFVRDAHGSDRLMLNASTGNDVGKYDFQAFGEAIDFDPKNARTTELFAGDGEFDTSTGLYYHDSRYRDAARFISGDSRIAMAGDFVNANVYGYVHGNPIAFFDPTGRNLTAGQIVAIGIAGALIASIVVVAQKLRNPAHNYPATLPGVPSPSSGLSGTFLISGITFDPQGSDEFGVRNGYQVEYFPAARPKGKIVLAQAIQGGGFSSHIDYAGFGDQVGRDFNRNRLPDQAVPGYLDVARGRIGSVAGKKLAFYDSPAGKSGRRISVVALDVVGKTETVIGALNFDWNEESYEAVIANGVTIAGPSTTRTVNASAPSNVWEDAYKSWKAGR